MESADVRLAAAPAAAAVPAAAAASDWLRSARKTWDAITRMLASSRFSSAFFALLPSLYAIGVLIYINVQLAKDLVACTVSAAAAAGIQVSRDNAYSFTTASYGLGLVVSSLTTLIGALTGVATAASLASLLAIWQKWPGVLSFWTWTAEVLKDWFIVTFAILLFSWQSVFATAGSYVSSAISSAFVTALSQCTLGIMVSVMLPAIFVWQLAVSVVTRQRMIFSGE